MQKNTIVTFRLRNCYFGKKALQDVDFCVDLTLDVFRLDSFTCLSTPSSNCSKF